MRRVAWIFNIGVPAPPVTGPIHDIGQNISQSSFQTRSSSSLSYCHSFFLIAFLEEVFIRNTL